MSANNYLAVRKAVNLKDRRESWVVLIGDADNGSDSEVIQVERDTWKDAVIAANSLTGHVEYGIQIIEPEDQ